MGKFDRAELEQSFRRYWQTGAVGEDWDAWSNLFTPDALYVEHMLGTRHGREAAAKHGPRHKEKRTRLDWGGGPAWTRGAKSWFERLGAPSPP